MTAPLSDGAAARITDYDAITEASKLMRQRAAAATPSGRREVIQVRDPGPFDFQHRIVAYWPTETGGEASCALADLRAYDAQHIAPWTPVMALAVADWLDGILARHDSTCRGCRELDDGASVARVYLGGSAQDGHGGQERAADGRGPVEPDSEMAEAPTGPQGGAEGVAPLKFPVHCGHLGDVEDCRRPGEPFTVALDPGDPAIDCPRCRLRLASDVLKPQEWCDRYGLTILDPDGWRQAVAPDWNERIALSVFYVLLAASTSNVLATGAHDRITADLALVYAEAPDAIAPEDEGIGAADVTAQLAADQRTDPLAYRAIRRGQHPEGGQR